METCLCISISKAKIEAYRKITLYRINHFKFIGNDLKKELSYVHSLIKYEIQNIRRLKNETT